MSILKNIVSTYKPDNISELETFGIVLYNGKHANVIKVLRDEDYWRSFNERSGDKFVVFSVKPKEGCLTFPKMPKDTFGLMVPTWHEPSENQELLDQLGLKDTENLPCLLVFTEIDGEIVSRMAKIEEGTEAEVYKSLSELLDKISKEINEMDSDSLGNRDYSHSRISAVLARHTYWKRTKKALDLYSWVKGMGIMMN